MGGEIFKLPAFTYFKAKNIYTGSYGKTFNYKIWVDEDMTVKVWYGLTCFSKTPPESVVAEESFPLSAEGLEELKAWLFGKYEEYRSAEQ